jgi:hypothetical protein
MMPPFRAPITIGQILDRTFRLVRANFRLFVGIAAIPALISFLTLAAFEAAIMIPMYSHFPKPPDPQALARSFNPAIFIPSFFFVSLITLSIFALYLAAAFHAASQANLGIPVTFREAYQVAMDHATRYIFLLLLIYVVTFLPAVVIELSTFGAMALYTLNNPNPNPAVFMLIPLGILLFLAAFVCGILIALRLALAFPACVVESLGVIASLKRSNQLTKGAKGRTFVVLLVIYAACYAFTIVLFAVLGLLGLIFLLAGTALGIHLASPLGIAAAVCLGICTFLGFFLYMALSWASFTTALAVIYGDQRFHKDTPPQAPTPAGAPA